MPIHAGRVLVARKLVAVAAVVAVTVLTPCASLVGLAVIGPTGWSGSAGAATSEGPSWAGYFFPLKVGWTCHESLTGGGASGSETLTVSAVGNVPQGRSVTVTEGSSSTVNGTSVPTNAVLHYILSKSGQLITVPSGGQVAGQLYNYTGDTTDPSVKALLSGKSTASHAKIVAPLSATDLSELRGVLPANATSLNMTVESTQRGGPVRTLQTAMGTFHHVIAVHSKVKAITFTNVSKGASKELAAAIMPTIQKKLAATTWYAPGVGPVKITTDGFTSTLTSCGLPTG
jgi:hypothetical protein